jgi:putative peptidoglycan lipid II flippase
MTVDRRTPEAVVRGPHPEAVVRGPHPEAVVRGPHPEAVVRGPHPEAVVRGPHAEAVVRSPHRRSFLRAFLASALGTGLSRILGAAREVAVAAVLGVGSTSDAFNLAWTIPNVFRRFVADEGLTGAMIPALARAEAEGGDDELRRLGTSALMVLTAVNVALCAAGVVLAEPLVLAFAASWRHDPDQLALAVTMTRWMFPLVGMVSTVSYFEGLLNYRGHFFVPKLAPAMISAGVVGAAVLVSPLVREPVFALVLGTVAGGVTHVLVNLPPLARWWGRMPWVPVLEALRSPRLRSIGVEMSKVVAIGLFAQINILVLQQLATSLPAGSLTVYRNSLQLTDLAQGVIAVAIGSALLPNISLSVSAGRWDAFRVELARALQLAAFLLVPAAVLLFTFGEPVTAMLFRLGRYSWDDVQRTAAALQLLAPFVLVVAGTNILKKVYFALEDRGTLLVVGAIGVALTALIGKLLTAELGVRGLALALSVSTTLQLGLYVAVLRVKLGQRGGLHALAGPLAKIGAASVPFGGVLAIAAPLGRWANGPLDAQNWVVFGGALGTAGAVYAGAAWLLGVPQVAQVAAMVRRRLGR